MVPATRTVNNLHSEQDIAKTQLGASSAPLPPPPFVWLTILRLTALGVFDIFASVLFFLIFVTLISSLLFTRFFAKSFVFGFLLHFFLFFLSPHFLAVCFCLSVCLSVSCVSPQHPTDFPYPFIPIWIF